MSSFFRRLRHTGLHRPRLLGACAWGLLVWLALPDGWDAATRMLVAWNGAVWPYLASMAWLMLRAPPQRVRAIASQENASTGALLAVMSGAAVLSIAAIVAELALVPGTARGWSGVVLPLVTVTGSWFLVGVIYTFHYAHLFYEAPQAKKPLQFPDQPALPTYRDFLYFSFTICATAQTSDVAIASTAMRTAVLAQSVLSFFFNVAVLGLAINIAAGLVGAR
jgi:uncharacterized membrane protein